MGLGSAFDGTGLASARPFGHFVQSDYLQQLSDELFLLLFIEGAEIFEIDKPFVKRCAEEKLFDLFPKLRGADLVYACAARVMSIPLATFDSDFQPYSEIISLYYL